MRCQAPKGFRPASQILWASPTETAPEFALHRPRRTGARRLGQKYESRAQAHFQSQYGERYLANPWIKYQNETGLRWCQPDGLLFDIVNGRIVIVEIKYNHTSDAWWQLRHLYVPIVQVLFSDFEIRICEVCKWYDCAVVFPESITLMRAIEYAQADVYNLHIWRP